MDPSISSSSTCRLCLAPDSASCTAGVVQCFGAATGDEFGWDKSTSVADVLNKHFWFELHHHCDAEAFVCRPCWSHANAFHRFYLSVETAYQQHQRQLGGAAGLVLKTDVDEDETVAPESKVDVLMHDETTSFVDCGGGASDEETPDRINDLAGKAEEETSDTKINVKVERGPSAEPAVRKPTKPKSPEKERAAAKPSAKLKFACTECSNVYTTFNRLASHKRSVHDDQAKTTTAAEASASPKAKESPHLKTKKNGFKRRDDDVLLLRYLKLTCDDCGQPEFSTFAEMAHHHRHQHQREAVVMCCGKRYPTRRAALIHCHWHDNPRQFDCPTCGKNLPNAQSVAKHIERKHPNLCPNPTTYLCQHCAQQFPYAGALRRHVERAHTDHALRRFECFECHQRYSCASSLRAHLPTHSTERSFVCPECPARFKTQHVLDQHFDAKHRGGPQQCPECGKWTPNASAYKKHMNRWHIAQRAAVCPECGFVGASKALLAHHRRQVHQTYPMQKCTMCEKSFRRAKALRQHMAIHLGIDLYRCKYCPATFRFDTLLYTHRKKMHGAEVEADLRAKEQAMAEKSAQLAAAAAAAAAAGGGGGAGGRPSVVVKADGAAAAAAKVEAIGAEMPQQL